MQATGTGTKKMMIVTHTYVFGNPAYSNLLNGETWRQRTEEWSHAAEVLPQAAPQKLVKDVTIRE